MKEVGFSSWHNRDYQGGGVFAVMINDIGGFQFCCSALRVLGSVKVSAEAREVTTRDFQPEFVTGQEYVGSGP